MPVSLGEWRVRIGTFMRRRRKEYDYHYFWRKLHNLIKKHKNAEPPKENNNPECNISSRTGSSPGANRSPSNTARQSAFSAQQGIHVTSTMAKVTQAHRLSHILTFQSVILSRRVDPHAIGSSIEKETNPVPDSTDVTILVPKPCGEDELDNNDIAINLMSHEYTPKSAQIGKTDKPEVGTSESHSHVPAYVHGETDRINRDKEETDSAPSGIEDQSSDLSPKHRLNTTRNTDQKTSSIREVTEYHESPIYPILGSGTSSGEADETKGNDCPDMTNILLMRSGDVEQNPGPNDKPGNLTDLELYLLADSMDPSDFRKVGLALGFKEAELSRFEKDQMGNTLYATYKMLYEWRKRVRESEARETLVVTLQRIKLVQLADSVQKGQVGDHIPSLTEEEIQRVAEEVKHYLAIHLCQIQADPLNSELVLEFKRIFTNLTLMEEDKGTKRKTPLLYDNLLRTKVNGTYPKRLLVEGEGGVGKTTFCAKIAWDWIHGKEYQDFKLVLVILLRKAGAKSVGEIVKSYLSDNNPVTAKQLDKHILSNPDDVFLVLDGLDEFAVGLDSNQQIALITLNHLFKSGTVLITSRQWRSDEIRMNADLRKVFAFIALEGFSAENLSSYITKFFHPDAASSEDLSQFISNNDVIRENMAPYPIYTAMLCIMWKEFDGERREAMSKLQTFSQLFNQMIDFLVDHHLSKHIPSLGIVGGKLSERCSDIRHHLIHIGRIAFQGLLERRLVFTEEEFQSYPESIDVGCKVGVLAREKKILPRRDRRNTPNSVVQSVQFPHKLFQEYLSGMYLASLYQSNRNEYYRLIANIIKEAVEYRYLLYFTSAQQKEVGLDIISRLIESKTKRQYGRIDDDFIVDVAYESQDQEVAKAVADHLSTTPRKTLWITEEMQAHTVSGHTFIMNHRKVDDLIIKKPCGRTASEDLAEFMCSSRSLRSVTIDLTQVTGTMHDIFYSVLANKAVDSKIETLDIHSGDLRERPSASRDLAQFIFKMTHLKDLKLDGQYHDAFYSTSSSMASSAKIETLNIHSGNLSGRPSIETLNIHSGDLSERPYASRDLAQFISIIETLDISSDNLSGRPSASRDLAQFICKMTHLKKLELGGQFYDETPYHDDFYFTVSSMASSQKEWI
eukprot:XP_011681932.1 PREDICTED: uncharacterized protein LOC105446612 [Strongylocentrotus purpuratus]